MIATPPRTSHQGRLGLEGRVGLIAELAAAAFLILLPWLFFWPLFAAKAADRAVLAWGDLGAQYYPLRLFIARELAQGRLPLWNPLLNAGQPALADAQSAVFYPPNLLLAWLAPGGELTMAMLRYYVVAHFALAGVLTYLFARYLLRGYAPSVARLAGLGVAIVFTFGGYLTSFPVQQLTILEAGVWLPLILLLLDMAMRRRSRLLYAASALPVAMSWLAGHAQTTMYCLYLSLAYVVTVGLLPPRLPIADAAQGDAAVVAAERHSRLRQAAPAILGGCLAIAGGSALAAVQLLPSYEFLARSTRLDLAYADTSFGLPPRELLGLVLPGAFGGRTLYTGILGLTMAALAFLAGNRRQVSFWQAAALGASAIALGGNTFLYSVLYLLAPGFSSVRDQERAVFLASFSVAVLAGYGLAHLLSPTEQGASSAWRRLRGALFWASVTVIALGVAAAIWPAGDNGPPASSIAIFAAVLLAASAGVLWLREKGLPPSLLGVAAVGLLIFDLFTISWQANLARPADAARYVPSPITARLEVLLGQNGRARLSSEGLLSGGGSAGVVFRLPDIVGNTPFQLQRYARINDKLDELQRSKLLAVRYWLTKRDLHDGRLIPILNDGDLHLYELAASQRLDRAFVVHLVQLAADDDEALRLTSTADLARVAVIERSEPGLAALGGLAPPTNEEPPPEWRVNLPARRELQVDLSTAGLLVFSDVDYPGWQAYVDGVATAILRADYLLQGVPVPAGRHVVELSFDPPSLRTGLAVSALALLVLVVVSCFPRRRPPSRPTWPDRDVRP